MISNVILTNKRLIIVTASGGISRRIVSLSKIDNENVSPERVLFNEKDLRVRPTDTVSLRRLKDDVLMLSRP
jgi:hypothetical protein